MANPMLASLQGRLQNLRRTLQRERDILARQESAHSDTDELAMPDTQNPRRRRYARATGVSYSGSGVAGDELRRRALTRPTAPTEALQNIAANAESSTAGRRATGDNPLGQTPSLRRLRQNHSEASAQLQLASERLSEAQSRLDALLQDPAMRSLSLSPSNGDPRNNDAAHPRVKRRRLEQGGQHSFQGFQYGHFGQVVAGPLKMEIVSCDGGNFAEDELPSMYGADNVLRNDSSVYCTQSSQCNLILRHQGETPFSLERLVIRAPEHNYTAPVQEGMVFVSMTSEDLLKKTQEYRLTYSRSPSQTPSISENHGEFSFNAGPLIESATNATDSQRRLRDDSLLRRFGMPDTLRSSGGHPGGEQGLTREEQTPVWSRRYRAAGEELISLAEALVEDAGPEVTSTEHCDINPSISTSALPGLSVTIEACLDSEDEDSQSSAHTARWTEAGFETDIYDHRDSPFDGDSYRPSYPRRRAARRVTPSRIEARGVPEGQPSGSHLLPPHATFFIEKNKSKLSIKFDPPVSGKFILLKLWSPRRDDNIDIQSIVAYGYAGTRYFPSVQMR